MGYAPSDRRLIYDFNRGVKAGRVLKNSVLRLVKDVV